MDQLTLFPPSRDQILLMSTDKAWPCGIKKKSIKIYHQLWFEIVPISMRNNSAVSVHKVIHRFIVRGEGYAFVCLCLMVFNSNSGFSSFGTDLFMFANVNWAVQNYYNNTIHGPDYKMAAALTLHTNSGLRIKAQYLTCSTLIWNK